jgi:beta-phosphoglucomutase
VKNETSKAKELFMSKKFTAIIFDMDGVLVDSEIFYYQRRKDFLQAYNLSFDKIPLPELVGADMRSLWQKIAAANQCTLDIPYMTEKYLDYKKKHPLNYKELIIKDAKGILQLLKNQNYKLGLASSSTKAAIEEVLAVAELETFFDVIVSGADFERSKPAPDIYQYVTKVLAVEPKDCLAIEDSEKGIQSAKSAGLTVWAIRDQQFGMDQSQADELIAGLSDLKKMLKNK